MFGVTIKLKTSWEFSLSVTELSKLGIKLHGCYVVPFSPKGNKQIGYKVAGGIQEVQNNEIHLYDARDESIIDADNYTIKGSLENVSLVLKQFLSSSDYSVAMREIRNSVSNFLSAEEQQNRIEKIAESMFKKSISCALGLTATVSTKTQRVSPDTVFKRTSISKPDYLLMLRSLESLEFIKSHTNSLEIQMCTKGKMVEMPFYGQAFQFENSI